MSKEERTLFCGNLSEKVTEDVLYEFFLQAGPLEQVTIPKDNFGRPRKFAFITFKHAVSVPYTVALMNGISLFGKPLNLNPRGAESEPNPYLEKLVQYRNALMQQNLNRNYNSNERDQYEDTPRRYDSRRYPESYPETQRMDYRGLQTAYPPSIYNAGPPVQRYNQNTVAGSYSHGNRMPWSRSNR